MATIASRLMKLQKQKDRALRKIDKELERLEHRRHVLKRQRNDVEESFRQKALKVAPPGKRAGR